MSAMSRQARNRSVSKFRFDSGVFTKRSGSDPAQFSVALGCTPTARALGHEPFFAQGAFKFAVGRRGQDLAGEVEHRFRLSALVVLFDPSPGRLVLLDVDVLESDAQLAQMLQGMLRVRAPIRTVNFHFHARNDSKGSDECRMMNDE